MKYSPSRKTPFRKNPLYALVLLALTSPYASADIVTWTGNTNSDITEQTNWETTESDTDYYHVINTPNGSHNPEIVITSDGAPSLPGGGGFTSLQIGNASGQEGQLSISKADDASSNHITISDMQVGLNGGTGELTIYKNDNLDPGQRKVLAVQSLNIGEGTGSTGTVNILGSGKTLEEQNGSSSETVGSHNLDLRVGLDGGTGTLNVNGASVGSGFGSLNIGSGASSAGEVNVLGGGKLVDGIMSGTNAAIIGQNSGTGTLNISGISEAGYSSRALLGQGMTVGDSGTGTIHVGEEGRLLTYGDPRDSNGDPILARIQLGVNGGTGKVTVDGANAIWMVGGYAHYGAPSDGEDYNKGQLYLGASGTGEVTLANGGELTIGEANFGYVYDEETGASYNDLISFTDGTGVLHLGHEAGSQGTLNIGAAQGQTAQGTGVLKAKEIQFGDGTGTLVFNHTDNTGDYAFDTPLLSSAGTGQGHIVQVAGVTAFNADQNLYTGNIAVQGGTLAINGEMLNTSNTTVGGGVLAVNGTLGTTNGTNVSGGVAHVMGRLNGTVNLNGTGVLSGTGSVGTTTVGAGGTVSPGDALGRDVGTLTLDDVTFNAGSIYKVQVNPDGQSDLIHASTANGGSGKVVINGGTISLQAGTGNWADHTKYTIISAEGGVTGAFDGVDSNLAFLSAAVQEDATDVYLYLTRNSTGLADVGETFNEVSTGKGIESLGGGNPIYDTILTMSAEQANNAYNNLSGEIHASVQSAMLANSRHARAAVNQHLRGLDTREVEPHQNLWVSTWAHDGHLKGDGNASRLNNKGFGVLMGADAYDTGSTTIGAAIGYERSDLDIGGTRDSKADVDAVHVMAYGRTQVGVIDVRGGVGYSWLDIETTRNITVPALLGENKASYNGGVVQIFTEGSHTFNVAPKIDVTPYLGLAYQRIKTNSFTEKGGDAVLQGNGKGNDVVLSTVGVRGAYSINERSQVYVDLGWQHNFSNDAPQARMNFRGGSNFDVRGAKVNANSALIGLGAKFELKPNMSLSVGYEGAFGNQSRDHAGKLLWEIRF